MARTLVARLFLGILVFGTLPSYKCQEIETFAEKENVSVADGVPEEPGMKPFEQNLEQHAVLNPDEVESETLQNRSNEQQQQVEMTRMLKGQAELSSAPEDTQNSEMEKVETSPVAATVVPSSAENIQTPENVISQLIHQKLVSQVVASKQQEIAQQQANSVSSQRSPKEISAVPGQGQLFAQGTDGQLYTLLPVQAPPEPERVTNDDQSRVVQAQAIQLQLQAQIQQVQAAQLQRLQEQLDALSRTTPAPIITTQAPQITNFVPIAQTQVPLEVPLQVIGQDAFLFDPRLQQPSQLQLAQNQYTQILQQQETQSSPTQSLFKSASKVTTPLIAEQSAIPSQSFKEQKVQNGIEVIQNPDINKLIAEIGMGYSAVEDTPQYTIYQVREPEAAVQEPKPRYLKRPPTLLSYKGTQLQSDKTAATVHGTGTAAPPHRPFKIVPADVTGNNVRSKPERDSKKPQTVYKSIVDPDYYNAVRNKLITSFSSERFQPFLNPYGPVPPPPHVQAQSHGDRNRQQFPAFGPREFSGEVPPAYDQKPFRPSPVDLGPLVREPLFESGGHNQPIGSGSVTSSRTVHPPKFSSKYVDIDYSPGVVLPADEAAFAALQARNLGGPAFIDEGYLQSALGFELNGKILEPFPSNPDLPPPYGVDAPELAQHTMPEPTIKYRPENPKLRQKFPRPNLPKLRQNFQQTEDSKLTENFQRPENTRVRDYMQRLENNPKPRGNLQNQEKLKTLREKLQLTEAPKVPEQSEGQDDYYAEGPENLEKLVEMSRSHGRNNKPYVELKEIDESRRPMVPPHLLAKILRDTTGEEVELENY